MADETKKEPKEPKVKQGNITPGDLSGQSPLPARIRIAGLTGLYGGKVRFGNDYTSNTRLTHEAVRELKERFGDAVEELAAADDEDNDAQG